MVSFPDYYNSIFNDRAPYKHKNCQLHGSLIIPVQMFKLIFSSYAKS